MRRNELSFIIHPANYVCCRNSDCCFDGREGTDCANRLLIRQLSLGRGSGFGPGNGSPAVEPPKTDPPAPLTTPLSRVRCNGFRPPCSMPGPWARSPPTESSPARAWWQDNHVPGDDIGQAALSNGQIFIQKADGKFQYFIEVGAYTLPVARDLVSCCRQDRERLLWACSGRLPQGAGGKNHAVPHRRSADADGRRVHLHV